MRFTLSQPYQLTEEVKKSRFVTYASPINNTQQINEIINSISDSTATHNCWAWKLGQQYRFNDDGEPAGTAGRPILSAIEGQQCDNVIVIVTRWFGGIKLGTGGLARAYGGGAARCLQNAPLIEIIPHLSCELHCYYSEWPVLKNKLQTIGAILKQHTFDSEGPTISLSIPQQQIEHLQQWLKDFTKGRVQAKIIIPTYIN